MATKKLLLISIFIFISFCLYAKGGQDEKGSEESRSTVVKTKEGLLIRQFIYFPAIENIFRYEIEIERLNDGSWVSVQELETEVNSFEVTLTAGDYRYRYTAYNLMNLFEGRSDWQDFRLNPAITPSPESYQPFYGMYYEMSDFENILTVYGNDFSDKTEFALVKKRANYDWSGVSLHGRKDVIIPSHVESGENQARLDFTRGSLKSGKYQIFARNPGGLWVCFGEVRVGFHSSNDFLFEYGYSPTFSEDNFFNGQYLRIGWFPIKTGIGNFGLGSQSLWGIKSDEDNDILFSLNILYQYTATERLVHNVRLGFMPFGEVYWVEGEGGYWVDEYDENNNWIGNYYVQKEPGYDVNKTYFYINFGYSAQYFFFKNFYAAAGVDILYALTDHGNKSKFYINPFIGAGFQVGRWGDYAEVAKGLKKGEDYSVPVTKMPKGEHILSAGWLPMIPLYGIDLYGNRKVMDRTGFPETVYYEQGYKFLNSFNPIGVNLRYSYLPHVFGNNKIGYDFEFTYLSHDNYSRLEGEVPPIDRLLFGIRYQRVLNESLQFNARAAAGIAKAYNFNEDTEIKTPGTPGAEEVYHYIQGGDPYFALNAGSSIQYFFWKNMFAEASMDMMFVFADTINIQLRPGISFGWQFNRGGETGLRLPEYRN